MTSRIDAHQHFWHPARGDYRWLRADLPICRPFGPADLAPHLRNCRIDGTLLVQTAPTLGETEYLLGIADATSFVRGVVGWVDFDDPGNRSAMERLGAHPKLKGLRPMIQDLPDDRWMLRTKLRWAFDALEALNLVFDALVFPRHLDHLLHLLQRHPALVSVIDHGGKPNIRGRAFADWAAAMKRLARETSACCKLSGLATEAGSNWTVVGFAPLCRSSPRDLRSRPVDLRLGLAGGDARDGLRRLGRRGGGADRRRLGCRAGSDLRRHGCSRLWAGASVTKQGGRMTDKSGINTMKGSTYNSRSAVSSRKPTLAWREISS